MISRGPLGRGFFRQITKTGRMTRFGGDKLLIPLGALLYRISPIFRAGRYSWIVKQDILG